MYVPFPRPPPQTAPILLFDGWLYLHIIQGSRKKKMSNLFKDAGWSLGKEKQKY